MPLEPVTGTLRLPVETAADVVALWEAVVRLPDEPNAVRRGWKARDLADHLFYLGAARPHLAAPLRDAWARMDQGARRALGLGLSQWMPLLSGADDTDVDRLAEGQDWPATLAAVSTPYADARLGEKAIREGRQGELARMGVAVRAGRAERRFAPWRKAVRKVPVESRAALRGAAHPIGLALEDVASDGDETISWHYLSLDLAAVEGFPRLPFGRLHLVSPRAFVGWTLFAEVADGRYRTQSVLVEDDEADLLDGRDNDAEGDLGRAELLPYDDRLVYSNGHVMGTAGVVGTVGGPPLGLGPSPDCPSCGRLMFHALTVEDGVREYGDGFRSLFVCEGCGLAACGATSFN